jgi:hypothetical protein
VGNEHAVVIRVAIGQLAADALDLGYRAETLQLALQMILSSAPADAP